MSHNGSCWEYIRSYSRYPIFWSLRKTVRHCKRRGQVGISPRIRVFRQEPDGRRDLIERHILYTSRIGKAGQHRIVIVQCIAKTDRRKKMHIATLCIFMSDPGGIINSVPLGTQPQRVRKPMNGRRKAGINGISVTLQAETIAQLGIVHPDFIVQRIVLSDSVGPIQIITAAEKQLMFFRIGTLISIRLSNIWMRSCRWSLFRTEYRQFSLVIVTICTISVVCAQSV